MAAAAYRFLANVNFDGKSDTFSLCIKFIANTCISDRVMIMNQNVNFNMATATILDFVGYGLWRLKLFQGLIFSLCVKFGANPFKNGRVMAIWLFSKWWPPPFLEFTSGVYFFICSFLRSGYGCSCKISWVYVEIRLTHFCQWSRAIWIPWTTDQWPKVLC